MVAEAMAVVIVNCAAVVDAAATIPSLASTVAAQMLLPPLPSTAVFINDNFYCCHGGSPLPLLHS
jgi:hypothetical protein